MKYLTKKYFTKAIQSLKYLENIQTVFIQHTALNGTVMQQHTTVHYTLHKTKELEDLHH